MASVGATAIATSSAQAPSGFSTRNGWLEIQAIGLFTQDPVSQGSTVYADQLQLEFINFIDARTITVTSYQNATGSSSSLWFNQTYSVPGYGFSQTFDFNLPSSSNVRLTKLCTDGACITFTHQTPLEFLPVAQLTQGSFDLYMLFIGLETLGGLAVATIAAYGVMRKARWAKTPNIALILPHVVLALFGGIALAAQSLAFLMAGFAFLGYPPLMAIGWFFWVLHLFNQAEGTEIRRLNPRPRHGVDANAMNVALTWHADGSVSVISKKWIGGWWARIRGKYLLVHGPAEPGQEPPAIISLRPFPGMTWRADPITHKRIEEALDEDTRELIAVYYDDSSDVALPNKNAPRLMAFVESDQPFTVGKYVVRWTREVPVPAKHGESGEVMEEATTRRKWSLPHFEGDGVGTFQVGPWHLLDGIVQSLIFKRNDNVFRRLNAVETAANAAAASYQTDADAAGRVTLLEYLRMEAEERVPLTEEEAEAVAASYRKAETEHEKEKTEEEGKVEAAIGKITKALAKTGKR